MARQSNDSILWWTIGGLIVFWLIAIPTVALSKPFGGVNNNPNGQ